MRASGDTGVQTHFRTFVEWLESKGHQAAIVTPFNAPRMLVYPVFAVRRIIDRLNGPASVWWYRYWHTVFLEFALRQRLASGKDCVVYAQCPLSADAALRARQNDRQKVVLVVHFNVSQADEWVGKGKIREGGALYRSIRKFETDVLPRLDGLVFVSDFMRREVMARMPATMHVPYRIVPNFLPDPGLRSESAKPEIDLVCIGTLEPRKNQRYALEIIAEACRLGQALHLTIVGDGPDRAMLEKYASATNIEKQVRFIGFVSDAAALMPAHRACLHVSRMESFGIVLIEAMARGLPVFAPAAGGMPEVFDDGVEGRLIPLDDALSAARVILEWLGNEKLLLASCAAARHRFLECYEADRVASELASFLDQVAIA